jgi:hypothetical protein
MIAEKKEDKTAGPPMPGGMGGMGGHGRHVLSRC